MTLKAAIDDLVALAALEHTFVHGTSTQTVATENGPLKTLAKLVADAQAAISQAITGTYTGNRVIVSSAGGAATTDAGLTYTLATGAMVLAGTFGSGPQTITDTTGVPWSAMSTHVAPSGLFRSTANAAATNRSDILFQAKNSAGNNTTYGYYGIVSSTVTAAAEVGTFEVNLHDSTGVSTAFSLTTLLAIISGTLNVGGGIVSSDNITVVTGKLGLIIGGFIGRSVTNPTNAVSLYDGVAPVGTMANGVQLYSTSGELRVMDAAGNATLLSPHDRQTNEWIYDSVDSKTGRRLRIQMERLMKALNDKFCWRFVEETAIASICN